MKLLLIHNRYQEPGGEETALAAQIALLEAHGHQIVLYQRDNEEIREWGLRDRLAALPRTLYARQSVRDLTEVVEREQPDLAHIHNVFPLISPAVYRALHALNVPMVQTVHNFRFLCPNSFFFTQGHICERCKFGNTLHAIPLRCYRDSLASSALYAAAIGLHRQWGTFGLIDRYLTLTPFAADKLVESGLVARDKIRVLGNFIPAPLPPVGASERPRSLVYIGRLSDEKGLTQLIEAMRRLPGLPLHLIGDGPERPALEVQARGIGLRDIHFHGYIGGRARFEWLRRASVAVVPSKLYENFPFAVLENLAVGTPVVGPRHGSFPHVIEEGRTGLLFEPGDSQDLARAVAQLLDAPSLPAMRRWARAAVELKYSGAAHYTQLRHHYHDLLDERAVRRTTPTTVKSR